MRKAAAPTDTTFGTAVGSINAFEQALTMEQTKQFPQSAPRAPRSDPFRAVELIRKLRGETLSASQASPEPDQLEWLLHPSIHGFGVGHEDDRSVVRIFFAPDDSGALWSRDIPSQLRLAEFDDPVGVQLVPQQRMRITGGNGNGSLQTDIGRADGGWSGSPGCCVRWRAHQGLYLLSNAHILALSGGNAPAIDDSIIRPSYAHGGQSPADECARLANWTRFSEGSDYPNLADAAIARLPQENDTVPGAARPNGINSHLFKDMSVKFFGAATGAWRSGRITSLGVCRDFTYPQPDGSMRFGFRGLVDCDAGAREGDSGSVVLDTEDRAVGLLFAGTPELAVFTPIRAVFDLLDLELSDAGDTSIEPAPPLGFIPKVTHPYSAIDVLARTLWGEARGESEIGMVAVAAVIANRTRAQRVKWGLTVEAVCKAPKQFSCWNPPLPNDDAAKNNYDSMLKVGPESPLFARCLKIARKTLRGDIADPTHGADHYYNPALAAPDWAQGQTPVATIGRHLFLRLLS